MNMVRRWLGHTVLQRRGEKEKIGNWKILILPQNSNSYKIHLGQRAQKFRRKMHLLYTSNKEVFQPDPLNTYPSLIMRYGKCYSYPDVSTAEIATVLLPPSFLKQAHEKASSVVKDEF